MNTVDVRAKLAELGLELPVAAKPVAAYVPAIRTGNLVFTAGQLPLAGGEMAGVGKVNGEITPERAKELAQICALRSDLSVNFSNTSHLSASKWKLSSSEYKVACANCWNICSNWLCSNWQF